MLCRTVKVVLAVSWILLLPKITWAQTSTAATVQGEGTVILRPQPVVLRMQVKLQSEGKTAKLALAKLKTRREAALAKLQALKADPASISAANPVISELQLWDPYSTSGYQPPPPSVSPPRLPGPAQVPHLFVGSVTLTLTADWPLEGDTPEELLLEARALREKIEAADIADTKDAETRSAEQPRVLEAGPRAVLEMAPPAPLRPSQPTPATSVPRTFVGPARPSPTFGFPPRSGAAMAAGGPSFRYVARLSGQQRKAALAEAFNKAKAEASELAEAAGARLGPLAELSGEVTAYRRGPTYPIASAGPPLPPALHENEAIAFSTEAIEFRVHVRAKFNLK